jgi:hypothetical protein
MLSLVLVETTTAKADEVCRRDVTGHMMGCSFDTMGQCEAMLYGLGGDCLRDPFLRDSSKAYAQVPKRQDFKQGKVPVRATDSLARIPNSFCCEAEAIIFAVHP